MTGFSIDWLDLREAADRRARNDKLLHQARHWLGSDREQAAELNMVDLGAGTGSTLRAFSTTVESDQNSLSWHLLDQDTALLAKPLLAMGLRIGCKLMSSTLPIFPRCRWKTRT